jgi:YfiH family protein
MLDFRGEKNKNRLCEILGIKNENLVIPNQLHGGDVEVINCKNFRKEIFTDALITNQINIALAVLTADCLPIFLYDTINKAIGIVHAGWHSTKQEIVKNCISRMQKEFATRPHNLKVALGPGIRECCYQVKENLLGYFPKHIFQRDNYFFLNLLKANLEQLSSLGVEKGNIIDSGICSSCRNNEFFSYRREGGSCGRTISVIMLNEDETYGAKRT